MRNGLAEAGVAPAVRQGRGRGHVVPFAPRRDPMVMLVLELVAESRGVPTVALLRRDRHAEVALARQLAMYLLHVCQSRIYAEVGQVFGRDRTTVSYACAAIEERRDEPGFDAEVERLEALLAAPPVREVIHATA